MLSTTNDELIAKRTFRGAKVFLAVRSLERGENARKEIVERSGSSKVYVRELDLTSFDSIRKFAKK